MPHDEQLLNRISEILKEKKVVFTTRNMIGGLCFMVNDKLALGIMKDSLLARIDPEVIESSLKRKGCGPMYLGGARMKGYVRVDPSGISTKKDLEYWITLCLEFNPKVKSRKK